MKKVIIFCLEVLLFLFFLNNELDAGERKSFVEFSISPAFSIVWGTIHEYVFIEGKKRSELSWDLKPLCMPGMEVAFIIKNFEAKGDIFFAINENTGNIQDYDWDESGALSHFSSHSSRQSGTIFSKMGVSYLLKINSKLSFTPGIGSKMKKIQLTAEDGYIEYPPGSNPVETFGRGIIYEQKYFIPYIDGMICVTENIMRLSAGLYCSSFLSCQARDSHVKRNIDFYDTIKRGKYFKIFADFELVAIETCSLTFEASYTYIPLKKGDSYYIELINGEKSPSFENGSGISAKYFQMIIFFKFPL